MRGGGSILSFVLASVKHRSAQRWIDRHFWAGQNLIVSGFRHRSRTTTIQNRSHVRPHSSAMTRISFFFKEVSSNALTNDEKKSEVNHHFGWAISSSMKRLKNPDALKLLESMRICSGGSTLVAGWIFIFGLAVISALRNEFTMEKMNRDPQNSFATAKKKIMENNQLKILFQEVCQSQSKPGLHN